MLMDLPDGRRLEVLVAGPEDGLPFVYQYGTPSGAVPYPPAIAAEWRSPASKGWWVLVPGIDADSDLYGLELPPPA